MRGWGNWEMRKWGNGGDEEMRKLGNANSRFLISQEVIAKFSGVWIGAGDSCTKIEVVTNNLRDKDPRSYIVWLKSGMVFKLACSRIWKRALMRGLQPS